MVTETNRVTFTVEFDAEAWRTLDKEARQAWIDEATQALADIGYVAAVEYEREYPITTHDSRCTLGALHDGSCNVKEWRG